MKNVLGIIGSTRKGGNSELAIKMISRHIPEEHTLNLIRLTDLDIRPCLGCYKCIKAGDCSQNDDMEIFLDAMSKTDAVILSVPVYFFGPHSSIKMIMDRCCMMYPRFDKFLGKPCVIAITLGIEGKDGYSSAALGSAALTMGLNIMGEANFFAAGIGEVLVHDKNMELAEELGRALFAPKREIRNDGTRCPICGSKSFMFIETGIECLVCQNQGELVYRDDKVQIDIRISSISELNTPEDRKHHLQWVQGMKNTYSGKREELKKRRQEYSKDGIWIKGNRSKGSLKNPPLP